jgi:hypothetical protein
MSLNHGRLSPDHTKSAGTLRTLTLHTSPSCKRTPSTTSRSTPAPSLSRPCHSRWLTITLYADSLEIDLEDAASVEGIMRQLDGKTSLSGPTRVAVALKVAQQLQGLGINCSSLLR